MTILILNDGFESRRFGPPKFGDQTFIFDPVSSCVFHLNDNPNLEIFVNRLDNANSVHYRLPLSTSSDRGP